MNTTPLVLLHGLGQSPLAWEDVVPPLYPSRPLLTPWVPGTRPIDKQALSLPDAAAALDQQLMLEGRAAVDVAGQSLGAMVAVHLAVDFPERVRRLVLIGGQVLLPTRALKMQRRLVRLTPRERLVRANVSKERLLGTLDLLVDADVSALLPRVNVPTLVLGGADDRAAQASCRALAQAIPGARLAFIPGAGAEPNTQQPGMLAQLLQEFLDE